MFKKASTANFKPLARTDGFSVTASGDETLVYDREQFMIHRLSPEMASIWQFADGTRDLSTLGAEAGVSNVEESLRHLIAMGLVQGDPAHKSLFSRRRILAGVAGAAAAGTFVSRAAASPVEGAACTQAEFGTWSNVSCGAPGSGHLLQCDWYSNNGADAWRWKCN